MVFKVNMDKGLGEIQYILILECLTDLVVGELTNQELNKIVKVNNLY